MLEDGDGAAHMVRADELAARAESAAQDEFEGEEGEEQDPSKPNFSALTAAEMSGGKVLFRRVAVPTHRFTPLKEKWMDLYQPIVKHMKLQIRMNLKTRCVELRTSEHTEEVSALQKAHDFIRAFLMGFEVQVRAPAAPSPLPLRGGAGCASPSLLPLRYPGGQMCLRALPLCPACTRMRKEGNDDHKSLESRYSDALL